MFLRRVYTLNCKAACVSVGLSADDVLFAHVFRGGFRRLIEMVLVCLWGCLPRMYYLHLFFGRFYTLN